MNSARWILLSALLVPVVSGCSGPERTFGASDCEAGADGCACNDNGSCDSGLECVAEMCVADDSGEAGSGSGGTSSGGTSSGGTWSGGTSSGGTSSGGTSSGGTSSGGTSSGGTSSGGTATGGTATGGTATGGSGGTATGGAACVPEDDAAFCSRLAQACGDVTDDDNCGDERTVGCGDCPGANASCDDGQCTCRPDSCAADACGEVDNGCDGTVQCGGCTAFGANAKCVDDKCECTTIACGNACGPIDDGCDGTLQCGGCSAFGTNAECVDSACECTKNTCGISCGNMDDGCDGSLNCGGCPGGGACVDNKCTLGGPPITIYDAGSKSGALGGRAGGDALCQAAMPANGCSTTHALLSVSATDEILDMPTKYGVPTDSPILALGGAQIADNWADLLDGTIDTSLGGAGVIVGTSFWYSGSNADGSVTDKTCTGWTTTAALNGTYGASNQTGSKWISTSYATCGLANAGADYHYLCVCWDGP